MARDVDVVGAVGRPVSVLSGNGSGRGSRAVELEGMFTGSGLAGPASLKSWSMGRRVLRDFSRGGGVSVSMLWRIGEAGFMM